ncbi:MAG: protein-(glutamine-N5) methyltransferase, release factor-specific, partial [Clostridiales bacterium]|nr:protein-(glutamine-N5) methyltransferase, release factor-specific [Clostridiales bacterium]
MLTIDGSLKWAVDVLNKVSPTPYLDAEIILKHIIKKDKIYLILNGKEILNKIDEEKFIALIGERSKYKPVQYI